MASGAVKRKHEEMERDPAEQSDSDQRQSILNISMVKLRSPGAVARRVDTSLRRSVLIFNTLRHIECQLRQEGVSLNPDNKPLPSLQPTTDLDLDLRPSSTGVTPHLGVTPHPAVTSDLAATSDPAVTSVTTSDDPDRTLHRLEAMEISSPAAADRSRTQSPSAMDTSESSIANSAASSIGNSPVSSTNPAALRPLVGATLHTLPPVSSLVLPSSFPGTTSLPGTTTSLLGASPLTTPLPSADTLLSDRSQSLLDARYLQESLLGCDRLTVASFMSMFELDSGAPASPAFHGVSYGGMSQSLPSLGSEWLHAVSYGTTSSIQQSLAATSLPAFGSEFTDALADLDLTPLDLDLFSPLTSKLTPLSAEELMHTLPNSDPFPTPTQNPSPCNHKNELLGEELDHVMQILRVGGN